jgi:hypothetical protein
MKGSILFHKFIEIPVRKIGVAPFVFLFYFFGFIVVEPYHRKRAKDSISLRVTRRRSSSRVRTSGGASVVGFGDGV